MQPLPPQSLEHGTFNLLLQITDTAANGPQLSSPFIDGCHITGAVRSLEYRDPASADHDILFTRDPKLDKRSADSDRLATFIWDEHAAGETHNVRFVERAGTLYRLLGSTAVQRLATETDRDALMLEIHAEAVRLYNNVLAAQAQAGTQQP